MTVSRVLRGGQNVRPEKVRSVQEAVAALGYRRNENARSIRPGQRTGLFGVIITNVANPYYAQLQLGVEEILAPEGVRLLVGNSDEDIQREVALVHDFIGRQVDGLIVVPSGDDAAHLEAALRSGIPIALASRRLSGLDVDVVLVDDFSGAYRGTQLMLQEGYTRIAYVGNMSSVFTSRRRLDGFHRAHQDAGVEVDPVLIRAEQNNPEDAHRVMRELLDLPHPPQAVFSANNRNTIGVLRAVAEAGLVPESVRVVGFDNFDLAGLVPFALSVIDHDPRELGRAAARMVMDRLQPGADHPPRLLELPTRLVT